MCVKVMLKIKILMRDKLKWVNMRMEKWNIKRVV